MRASAAVVLAAFALFACQNSPRYADTLDAEDEKTGWKEIPVQFPPYPRDENLVRFDVGDGSPHRFYIDSPSLKIGTDGVVRYTLVTKTAGGATNVTYEGIRCEGRRHKVYAAGDPGGKWAPSRNPQWRRIELQDPDRQRRALVDDFLCLGRVPQKTEKDALFRLRRGPVQPQFN